MAMKISTLVVSISVNVFINFLTDHMTGVYFTDRNVGNLSKIQYFCEKTFNKASFFFFSLFTITYFTFKRNFKDENVEI